MVFHLKISDQKSVAYISNEKIKWFEWIIIDN